MLEKLALESITEQRRRRRWGIFFRLIGFFYVGIALWMFGDFGHTDPLADKTPHTALVSMEGTIAPKGEIDAEKVIDALQDAFAAEGTKGIVLKINSPGGSPVQAGMINDEIRRLRQKYPDKPLYAVVEDICASGGYYVAVAADQIFVDKASMVGSIGVLMDGFGFTGAMDKVGVERRILTAGENKGFLDPFAAQNPRQVEYAKTMLADVHKQFIDVVRSGRGKRLKETPEMFSGLVWTGAKSIELGLADGYGTVESVARDVIQQDEIRDYTMKQSITERFAKQFGASAGASLAQFATNLGSKVGMR